MSGYYRNTGERRIKSFDVIWEVVHVFGKMKLMTLGDRDLFMHRLEMYGVESIGYEGRGELFKHRMDVERVEELLDILVRMHIIWGWASDGYDINDYKVLLNEGD